MVHRKWSSFEGPSVRAWIYGICLRKASDHRRLAHKKHERPSETLPEPEARADSAEQSFEHRRALDRLDRALADLDDDQRAAFVLYEIEGLSLKEVASACDCPLQTVYSRLAVARQRLERALAEPGGEPS